MVTGFLTQITRLSFVVRLVLWYNIYGGIEMRLRIDTNKDGTKNYYVLESFRTDNKKTTTRIVKKLGSHSQLLTEHDDPEAWAREVVAEMNRQANEGKRKIMVPFSESAIVCLAAAICSFKNSFISFALITYAKRFPQTTDMHLIWLKSSVILFILAF